MAQQGVTLPAEKKYIRNILKKNSSNNNFAIIDESGAHIGSASLDELNPVHKSAVFGIVIGDKSCWGKGNAGECIKLLANYLFERLKYNRLELKVAAHNKAAVAAYRKAGFVVEGKLRQHEWNRVTKRFEDNLVMSILREEWVKKYKNKF